MPFSVSARATVATLVTLLAAASILDAADHRRVSISLKFTITSDEDARDVTFTCLVPKTVPGRQTVDSIRYTPPPSRQFEKDGGMYAQFTYPAPGKKTDLSVGVDLIIHKFDLGVARSRPELRRMASEEALKPFLQREKYHELDDPLVTGLARKVASEPDVEVVRKLLTIVTEELKQSGYQSRDRGAIETLQTKDGDCTDYADVFVALCRAKGIPARICEGYLTTPVGRDDTQKHDWAEVYLKDLGWVPFDPFHVDLNSASFESLRPVYILLSNCRNDVTLGNFHFWYLTSAEGKSRASDQYFIHWQREE